MNRVLYELRLSQDLRHRFFKSPTKVAAEYNLDPTETAALRTVLDENVDALRSLKPHPLVDAGAHALGMLMSLVVVQSRNASLAGPRVNWNSASNSVFLCACLEYRWQGYEKNHSRLGTSRNLGVGSSASRTGRTRSGPVQWTYTTSERNTKVQLSVVARGLSHPWGLVFLPNGDMLVTERPGSVRLLQNAN